MPKSGVYSAAKVLLEIEGKAAGFLHSVDGGEAFADPVSEDPPVDGVIGKHPGPVRYAPIVMTCGTGMTPSFYDWIAEADADPVYTWHDDFVIQGNHGPAQERNGVLRFLGPNYKDVLFSIELDHLGVLRVAPERHEANAQVIARSHVEMYCEQVRFSATAVPAGAQPGGAGGVVAAPVAAAAGQPVGSPTEVAWAEAFLVAAGDGPGQGVARTAAQRHRDYLDVVALAERLGPEAAPVLAGIDAYYEDQVGPGGVATQLAKQLAEPAPYDLSDVDLRRYRRLDTRWQEWDRVVDACGSLATGILNTVAGGEG